MLRVLVVDDSKFNRGRVVTALKTGGIEISEACDGQDALERLESISPDVICTDLLMPKLDGFGFLRALKERGNKIPVIVLSADIQASSRQTCLELGVVAFLNKPFQPVELLAEVEKAAAKMELA